MTAYGRRAARRVRYGGRDSDVLRSVLYDLSKSRCYWCGRIKDFTDVKTDHLIPKKLSGKALTDALDRVGRPHTFDRDDPENLAPICAYCNGPSRKGEHDMTHLPLCAQSLDKARELRTEVVNRVLAFGHKKGLARAFVALKSADLGDDETRRAFEQNMPAVVRKLSAYDELATFPLFRVLNVQVDDGEPLQIGLELEGESKRAASVLEDLSGATLEDVAQEPVASLWDQAHARAQASFEGLEEDGRGPCNSGPPVASYFKIEIEAVSLIQSGGTVEFIFTGELEAHLSASLVRDDRYAWDRDTVELQGDTTVEGGYSFTATWDGENVYADEPVVEWEPEDYWTSA